MASKRSRGGLWRGLGACVILVMSIALPVTSRAGMGMRASAPQWHRQPCEGDACKGDDPRSGLPCQGLLCTFSSAKSLQPPATKAEAPAPSPVAGPSPPAEPSVADAKPKPRKIARKRQKAEKVAGKLDAQDARLAAGSTQTETPPAR